MRAADTDKHLGGVRAAAADKGEANGVPACGRKIHRQESESKPLVTLQERVHFAVPPENWKPRKIRHIFRVRKGRKNYHMNERNLLSLSFGKIVRKDIQKTHGLLPKSFETYQIVDPGNLILRLTDLQNDWNSLRQGLVSERGIITAAYDALEVARGHDPRFWAYAFLALDYAKYYYSLGAGVRQSIKFSNFPNHWVATPDHELQKSIAVFLDHATAKLDRLIDKKKQLVELLKEKRKVLIADAIFEVMTDKVDAQIRLGCASIVKNSNVDKITNEDEIPIRLCNYVDVYRNDRITSDLDFMPASANSDEIAKFGLRVGDVIITKDSEDPSDIAVPAYVEQSAPDLVCGYHLTLLRARSDIISSEYLFWALQAKSVREAFSNAALGVTRFGLTLNGMKSVLIPCPNDIKTQESIVRFLNDQTARIDKLVAKTLASIDLLTEYRSALITAAVTGQIEVPAD